MSVGRPREYDRRVSTAVRLSPELHARVKAAAAERGVAANLLVNSALEDYLTRLVPVSEVLRTSSPSPDTETGEGE